MRRTIAAAKVIWAAALGRCATCGRPAPRSGTAAVLCDACLQIPREWVRAIDDGTIGDELEADIRGLR